MSRTESRSLSMWLWEFISFAILITTRCARRSAEQYLLYSSIYYCVAHQSAAIESRLNLALNCFFSHYFLPLTLIAISYAQENRIDLVWREYISSIVLAGSWFFHFRCDCAGIERDLYITKKESYPEEYLNILHIFASVQNVILNTIYSGLWSILLWLFNWYW